MANSILLLQQVLIYISDFFQAKTGKDARAGHLQNIRLAINVLLFGVGVIVATLREKGTILESKLPFYVQALIFLILVYLYIRKESKLAKTYLFKLKNL